VQAINYNELRNKVYLHQNGSIKVLHFFHIVLVTLFKKQATYNAKKS